MSTPGQLARMIQAQHELRSLSQRGGQEATAMKAVRRLNGGALAQVLGDPALTAGDALVVAHDAPIQRSRIHIY